ncbi:MAG: hypothetical protein ACE10F_06980 [Candidatus Methylomirabilales bacterium]|nr:hypothetical protein [candidate division NC10 bacterium]MCH7895624.1 hypothetical protein [candidate division NC10 bacterium]MCZ6550301.1 hypothetical protein [candidate division NC10 bacterium]
MDNAEHLAEQLHLAFQMEGLSVGVIQIRPHHLGLLEVEIDGEGPFILSPTLLETSAPEAGYVSEDLRAWIDQAYLKVRGHGLT